MRNMTVNVRCREITVNLDVNTDKFQQKLRTISKYLEALADELESIDNENDELPTHLEGSE